MKINKTYQSLLDKSLSSLLSAIEIYNKPHFMYREETFAILAVNAWELLLKAYLLRFNKYKPRSIYELKPAIKKNGSKHKTKKEISLNRCGNPKTKFINDILNELGGKGILKNNLRQNIDALIELRDNSIHFINVASLSKQVQELGFACIKNYISIIKDWKLEIDLSLYNFYLMPLAYIDDKKVVDAVITPGADNFVKLIKEKLSSEETDSGYDIAISINIDFKKGHSFDTVNFSYSPDGIPVSLSEEDFRKKYPLNYRNITDKCHSRYTNFKQNKAFNTIMKGINLNENLCSVRKLDPDNPKSASQRWYSSGSLKELDKHYIKKQE